MHAQTMEGLIGAASNTNIMNVPMRIYKTAERKGDTALMDRASHYAGDFAERVNDYKRVADEGMKKDAEEARQKEEQACEAAIEKRREEREKREEKLEKSRDTGTDSVEISDAGNVLLEENSGGAPDGQGGGSVAKREPVLYTKAGEISTAEGNGGVQIDFLQ